MKAKIISVDKTDSGEGYTLQFLLGGKPERVPLSTKSGDQLIKKANFMKVENSFFPVRKNIKSNIIDNVGEFIYDGYGRKELVKDLDEWIRFLNLCVDMEDHYGSKEHIDLLCFLWSFRDVLNPQKEVS